MRRTTFWLVGRGRKQRLGVRMLHCLRQRLSHAAFDNRAFVHNDDGVRNVRHNRQIMGYEHQPHAILFYQLFQQH